MKHIFLVATSFLTIAVLSMCKKDTCDSCGGGANNTDTTEVQELIVKRKVLLEAFLGQGCGNCPHGAIEAKRLEDVFNENLIVISVHAGYFSSDQYFAYATLSTPEGEAYNVEFGNSTAGNPNGMVNRIDKDSTKVHNIGEWSSAIVSIISDTAPLNFTIEPTFLNDTTFTTKVSGEFSLDMLGNYSIVCSMVEDSVVAPQYFYHGVGGYEEETVVDNNVHRHVLRGNVNGTWGTSFTGRSVGEAYSVNLGEAHLSSNWNKEQMYLVVYVYDNDTKEILHAGKTHISHIAL